MKTLRFIHGGWYGVKLSRTRDLNLAEGDNTRYFNLMIHFGRYVVQLEGFRKSE